MTLMALILAEGTGKRLKSSLPECLHPILGDPSLLWVLRALPKRVDRALVLHTGGDELKRALGSWTSAGLLPCPSAIVQTSQELSSEWERPGTGQLLILRADMPLVRRATLERLIQDGSGGRSMVREGGLDPLSGFRAACVDLSQFRNAIGKGCAADEVAAACGHLTLAQLEADPSEWKAMTSRSDQAALTRIARDGINEDWLQEGVGFRDPASAFIGPRVRLARDVFIDQGVLLEGNVRVGEGVTIDQGCVIRDSSLGAGTHVRAHCVVESAVVGTNVMLGPFARLREGTVLESGVHVGNYVETKKAHLKAGAKANHLTYLGDCEIGEKTNIGAGCITCNYDGFSKHHTQIGRDVFVGSDCQMVAPVTIGDGAIIGAGTTLTQDVAPGALALARPALVHKDGAAERLRAKLRSELQRRKS